ncbi:hypothetical protein BD626DRAFT_237815 [Schizophyllum amplum]|uniref:Uncharacterized protein n=1 Tax=Schizophyllum amplum TaxID=97359 RepID=A0A550CJF5_9AGAR|nr:hypothetical protein BD626DRAFT_237815 [Auriculariopsis ampla]
MPFTSPYSPFFTSGLLVHGAPTTPASLVGTPPLSDATGYFGPMSSGSSSGIDTSSSPDTVTREGCKITSPNATPVMQTSPSDNRAGSSQIISWNSSNPSSDRSPPTSALSFDSTSASCIALPSFRERKRDDALAVLEGDRSRVSDVLVPIATPSLSTSDEPYFLLGAETRGASPPPEQLEENSGAVVDEKPKTEGTASASASASGKTTTSGETSPPTIRPEQLTRRRSRSMPRTRQLRQEHHTHGREGHSAKAAAVSGRRRHGHSAQAATGKGAALAHPVGVRARSASPHRLVLPIRDHLMSFMEMQTPDIEKTSAL